MKTTIEIKTLFHRTLKNGVELEIAAGIYKPFFRDKKKGLRREFTLDIIPCVSYASSDHNWGYEKDNVCQTTLYIGWLIFYVYFETFRPVRGTAQKW